MTLTVIDDYVVPVPEEDTFYIVSPKDIVIAKRLELDDRITWLLDRNRCSEALVLIRTVKPPERTSYTFLDIGQRSISSLLQSG
jgi:hypothetical protein